MVASGTTRARVIRGFSRGSRRSASATGISSTGMPVSWHAGDEAIGVVRVIDGRGDEQAAGVLDAVGRDAAQDDVLPDAFPRRLRVLHGVPATGVQQAVEPAGGTGAQVTAFHQDGGKAAHGGVPGHADPGGAAADDENLALGGG